MVEAHMIADDPDRPSDGRPSDQAVNGRAGYTRRVLARSITADDDGTVVRGRCAGSRLERRLSGSADLRSARRWLGAVRRVDRVELLGDGPVPRCVLHGIGHRRAIVREIQLGTALGLGLLGVPLLVEVEVGADVEAESGAF